MTNGYPGLHLGRKREWWRHLGSQGKTYERIHELKCLWSHTKCLAFRIGKEGVLFPCRLKEWDINLCLYKGFWQHLPFMSSVFVFRKKKKKRLFTVWLSLAKHAEMKSCMAGFHFPPHCSSLHPRGAHYTTACSETSHSCELHHFSEHAYLLMAISSLSLNFRVQITQKGRGRQIFHMQHFSGFSCSTNLPD